MTTALKKTTQTLPYLLFVLVMLWIPRAVLVAQEDIKLLPDDCATEDGGCDFNNFIDFIDNVLKFLIALALAVAVILFIYAGFLYITASGNPEKIKSAHAIFKNTFIGILFVAGAWLIVYTIINALGVDFGEGGPTNFLDTLDPDGS